MIVRGGNSINIKNLLNGEISQEELLNYYNASIVYDYLPININGMVFNYKGINLIIINKELSYYKRKKTILHELAHIELNQLGQIKEVFSFKITDYEDEADKYLKRIRKESEWYTMKIGMRKPNVKNMVKAKTTTRVKKAIKSEVVPLYNQKGTGIIKDPEKAVYNKVYKKTTFGLGDIFKLFK